MLLQSFYIGRYPDDKAGQVPIAFVVTRPGSTINETLIKDFVAKEVFPFPHTSKPVLILSI